LLGRPDGIFIRSNYRKIHSGFSRKNLYFLILGDTVRDHVGNDQGGWLKKISELVEENTHFGSVRQNGPFITLSVKKVGSL
jgi:hypothetical protein